MASRPCGFESRPEQPLISCLFPYPAVHRLTVDTYCVQHPGKESPQSSRSVGIHLIALYVGLEMRVPLPRITAMMDRLLKKGSPFRWLKPPENLGGMSVMDIFKVSSFQDHEQLVCAWAKEVWNAWKVHHRTVQVWYEELAVPKVSDVWF